MRFLFVSIYFCEWCCLTSEAGTRMLAAAALIELELRGTFMSSVQAVS